MRVLESVWRLVLRKIIDIVSFVKAYSRGNCPKAGLPAHAISDHVIGAGSVAADPQTPDDLATLIERDTAAEGDHAAHVLTQSGIRGRRCQRRCQKGRVERIRIVQTVERAARLRRCIPVFRRYD